MARLAFQRLSAYNLASPDSVWKGGVGHDLDSKAEINP